MIIFNAVITSADSICGTCATVSKDMGLKTNEIEDISLKYVKIKSDKPMLKAITVDSNAKELTIGSFSPILVNVSQPIPILIGVRTINKVPLYMKIKYAMNVGILAYFANKIAEIITVRKNTAVNISYINSRYTLYAL